MRHGSTREVTWSSAAPRVKGRRKGTHPHLARPEFRPERIPLLIVSLVFDRDAERRVLLTHGVDAQLPVRVEPLRR